uniref:Uncharacterized protein n=1 Tax=Quercus lobata TaxID=97700 RepID=A0A7N2MS83_QUELO
MAGREVREYTNLTDPKDKKWGKGKEKIDDEDTTFQRMVAKFRRDQFILVDAMGYCEIRDLGFLYRAVDASKCKRLQESVEATFMGEAPWTVMIYSISRSKWKLRRMQNTSYVELRNGHLLCLRYPFMLLKEGEYCCFSFSSLTNGHKAASLADSSPASVPLPLRVEPKPKSGIRQQYLLKKVVEIKPKRKRTSSPSDGNQSTPASNDSALKSLKSESHQEKEQPETDQEEKEWPLSRLNKAEGDTNTENPVKSLLGLAYASSEDDD